MVKKLLPFAGGKKKHSTQVGKKCTNLDGGVVKGGGGLKSGSFLKSTLFGPSTPSPFGKVASCSNHENHRTPGKVGDHTGGGGGGWKTSPGNGRQLFSRSQPPEEGGGYTIFSLTHMTKTFTKQIRFKEKTVNVDLLTPLLHQCEDYGPSSTCKAW